MANTSTVDQSQASRFGPDSGYWIVIACGVALVLANTPLATISAGIIFVALIYQTNQLIAGK